MANCFLIEAEKSATTSDYRFEFVYVFFLRVPNVESWTSCQPVDHNFIQYNYLLPHESNILTHNIQIFIIRKSSLFSTVHNFEDSDLLQYLVPVFILAPLTIN